MEQRNNNKQQLLIIGAIMLVVCTFAIMAASLNIRQQWAILTIETVPWFFLAGAICFSIAQHATRTKSTDLTINRLYRIQTFSHISLIIASLLMIEQYFHFLHPLLSTDMNTQITYLQTVHNNWVVFVLIAAVIQFYTTLRLGNELKKQA